MVNGGRTFFYLRVNNGELPRVKCGVTYKRVL